jgi:cytochrome c oxidase subunit 2
MTMFWWCVAIAVFVFGWMICVDRHLPDSRKARCPTRTMTHSTKAEIIWTVIPVLILVIMAVPAARYADQPSKTRASSEADRSKSPATSGSGSTTTSTQGVSFFSTLDRDQQRHSPAAVGRRPERRRKTTCSTSTNRWSCPTDTKVRLLLTSAGRDPRVVGA